MGLLSSEADYARDAHNFHQKLWQKSNEKVPRTKLSFKELNGLIIKLLAPPPSVPIFGLFDAPKSQSDGVHQQVQQKNGISFLTSSSQGGKAEKEANIKTNGPRADSESPNKGDVPHQGDRKKKSSKSDSTAPTKKVQEKPSQTVENPQKKTQPRKNADEKTKNGKEKIESIVAKIEPVVVKKEKMTLQLKDATIKLL